MPKIRKYHENWYNASDQVSVFWICLLYPFYFKEIAFLYVITYENIWYFLRNVVSLVLRDYSDTNIENVSLIRLSIRYQENMQFKGCIHNLPRLNTGNEVTTQIKRQYKRVAKWTARRSKKNRNILNQEKQNIFLPVFSVKLTWAFLLKLAGIFNISLA